MDSEQITQAILDVAKRKGLINVTRKDVAEKLKITEAAVTGALPCSFLNFVSQIEDKVIDQMATPSTVKRANPSLRRVQILSAAIDIATEVGLPNVTRGAVARQASVADSLVSYYFPSMRKLRESVMRAAVSRKLLPIIAEGLMRKDPIALSASANLRKKAARSLANV